MSELHNVMQNIEVSLGNNWLNPNCYTGTKEDLIAAGLAKEFMFVEPPKRNKSGWLDCNGWPIDRHPMDDWDKYDWRGKTYPIHWKTERIKGGLFRFRIDKSWEEKQSLENPPLTEETYLEWAHGLIASALVAKSAAQGKHINNPKGYHLSKHHEITQLIDRVIEAARTSTVITTHDGKPFRVIDGDKI